MGTVILRFRGVNAYVPQNGNLMVVMPNATKLGSSLQTPLGGSATSSHMPVVFTRVTTGPQKAALGEFKYFPGARLTLEIAGNPTAPDFGVLDGITGANTWLDVDSSLLGESPDDRVAGQVLLKHGTATILTNNCNRTWLPKSDGSTVNLDTAPVILGIEVTIQQVDQITLSAARWVFPNDPPQELFSKTLSPNDTLNLSVGNMCAEDVLEWPMNSRSNSRINDLDLQWIFRLQTTPPLELPTLEVKGTGISDQQTPAAAMRSVWGGGGGAGCQCNGCGG